jgi:predicted amidohydrolase
VRAHDAWEHRLAELTPALVLGTRPVEFGNERYDEAFVWDPEIGMRSVHARSRAPLGAKWLHDAAPDFTPIEVQGLTIGFLIGSEIQAEDEARLYGKERIDLLAVPRCGDVEEGWLSAAQRAAVLAKAPVISSNRSGKFGGKSCIIDADGRLLESTSDARPFVSADVTLPNQETRAALHPLHAAPDWIDPLDTGVPPYG